jgi:hypothetical protein
MQGMYLSLWYAWLVHTLMARRMCLNNVWVGWGKDCRCSSQHATTLLR